MIALFLIVCLIVVAGLIVLWASGLSGNVVITLGADTISIELVVAILGVILLGAVMALVWAALAGLIKLPKRFGQARRNSKKRSANRSLADGILAAEAGDISLSRKYASRAAQHADDGRRVCLCLLTIGGAVGRRLVVHAGILQLALLLLQAARHG